MGKGKKIGIGIGLFILGIIAVVYGLTNLEFTESTKEEIISELETILEDVEYTIIDPEKSLFDYGGVEGENYVTLENGARVWESPILFLKDEYQEFFDEITLTDTDQKTAFIIPVFTSSAYEAPGFYNYYNNQCDEKCLTTQLEFVCRAEASCIGSQVLKLFGYHPLSDVEVDQNPEILKQYDRILVMHNEYVTQKEFDALNNHPKVIYLYPNANYALIIVDYESEQIQLIRGHGYPQEEINNGFDWEFDNSPLELQGDCGKWEFYEIDNGYMLNCYPENLFLYDKNFLSIIKDL